ncbi:DOMON-like domain-containing protein [Pseudanabaenaceae cyanobacterium LEGE 13415]|nr:DOMON-like domain-containing protein [Pseudanabaenaceae cyanobacterium LEGE 13415]
MSNFSLHPFDIAFAPATLNLSGSVNRTDNRLILQFDLFDSLSNALIPVAKSPTRQHNLWQTTCFEFFIGVQNSSQYWEFNLSPSGDWNVYRFESYRAEMQEESAFSSLPFELETRSLHTILSIDLNLNRLNLTQSIDLGITAVIETNQLSYWALKHCGKEADFHIRESFALQL